ncbi:MAG: glycoside hydrolase family protein [Opitutaceae bacterium]|jgi:lysozyme|nr:glycoside hydrolase family protein [Opitutaceae bacterium]
MDTQKLRIPIAVITLAAAGFGGIVAWEGYVETAAPPVKGDVPTYGFGSTTHADGSPVKAGEKITPPAAVRLTLAHIAKDETELKRCFGQETLIAQHEWDAFVSLAYNVGPGAVCASSIPGKLKAGNYEAACKTILDFNAFCTKPKVKSLTGKMICPPGAKRVLAGLTARRNAEYQLCREGA